MCVCVCVCVCVYVCVCLCVCVCQCTHLAYEVVEFFFFFVTKLDQKLGHKFLASFKNKFLYSYYKLIIPSFKYFLDFL